MSIFKKLSLILIYLTLSLFSFSLFGCKDETTLPSYVLNAVYKNGVINGNLRYKFVNNHNTPFDHVYFNLHANAYSENSTIKPTTSNNLANAFPNGLSYGGIEILSASALGEKCEYELLDDNNFLKVHIPTIYPNDNIEIDIDFKTTLPNGRLRLGVNDHAVNLADFFPTVCKIDKGNFVQIPYSPIGDPYYSQIHDYEVNITVPSEYVVASCGTPTQTLVENNNTTYSYELKSARDFAFAISKNYKVFSQNALGVTVNYYCFDDEGENLLKTAISALEYFSQTIGDYPYQTLSFAETEFVYGGMEFSSLCFISTELEQEEKLNSIIHETAHEWWYGGVSNDQYNSAYIDEGLAEFSSYLFLHNTSLDLANQMIDSAKLAYKSFFDLKSVLSGNTDTRLERPLSTFSSEFEYVNLVYNKSLLMFYEYQNLFGNEKTLKGLKTLYKTNFGKEIGRDEIIRAFGHGDHFNSYIDGKVII